MNQNSLITYGLFTMFLKAVSLDIALIMLNAPVFLIVAVTAIMYIPFFIDSPSFPTVLLHIYNFLRPILYIIALIVTIQGKQDAFAIAFYILFAIQLFSIIRNLLYSISVFYITIKNR